MNKLGGDWTRKKLSVPEGYWDLYTRGRKNWPFILIYIGACTGSGKVQIRTKDDPNNAFRKLLDGSVIRATETSDKPFDELIVIEKDEKNCERLERIRGRHKD